MTLTQARATHTTPSGKAKCLAYRNGKRCGRVATIIVHGNSMVARCAECAEGQDVKEQSPKGFTVHVKNMGGWVTRDYRGIP